MPQRGLPAWPRSRADGAAIVSRPRAPGTVTEPRAPGAAPRSAGISAPVSWPTVLPVAAGVFGVLVAVSPWYGYYRDELYFRLWRPTPPGATRTPPQ